jgi:hypothetical protein
MGGHGSEPGRAHENAWPQCDDARSTRDTSDSSNLCYPVVEADRARVTRDSYKAQISATRVGSDLAS